MCYPMEVICVYVPFARPSHLNSPCCRYQQHTRKSNCCSFREAKRYMGLGLSRAAAHLSQSGLRFAGRKGLEVIARWKDGRRFAANCSSDHRGNAESFFKQKWLCEHDIYIDLREHIFKFKNTDVELQGFSKLTPNVPLDHGKLWTTMATYFFLLHIPLSFGGLSIVAQVLHQEDLNAQTKAIALFFTQMIELVGAISLVQLEAKIFSPSRPLKFYFTNAWAERGWLKASIMGIAIIGLLVILASTFMQLFFISKAVKNFMLEEILSSGVIARCSCFVVYCIITPILEECMYRGFLLTSLTLHMEWPSAVIVSACVFSVAHFSLESALQIFIIGCVLGAVYTWSGNLASSFIVHFVYNFAVLMTTFLS